MHLVVKLDFAADLTLFPEYTIAIKINIIKNQAEFPIPSPNLWNAVMGRGTPLSCTLPMVAPSALAHFRTRMRIRGKIRMPEKRVSLSFESS